MVVYNLFGGVSQSAAICELVHRCVYLSVMCVYVRACICVCVRSHLCMCVHSHTCVCVCAHVCMCVSLCVRLHCYYHYQSLPTYLMWECARMLYSVLELCALVSVWVGV